jgi:hypothetical protein
MSLQQKRTVQNQTIGLTWAKVVAQGKPSQSQRMSVVSISEYSNDNGSVLVQKAIEKKYKLDLAKKQKQFKESNKPKPEQPKPKPQEPVKRELEQPKPELKTMPNTKTPSKLTKIELRKRAEIQKAKEDAALLRELVKISRLPKDKQEKLYDELLSRK